jgi:hypothetical protein
VAVLRQALRVQPEAWQGAEALLRPEARVVRPVDRAARLVDRAARLVDRAESLAEV